jgi:hypothetical protein
MVDKPSFLSSEQQNQPVAYNWAYEKRVNSFCLDLALELRRLTGREVIIDHQELPKRAEPKNMESAKEP